MTTVSVLGTAKLKNKSRYTSSVLLWVSAANPGLEIRNARVRSSVLMIIFILLLSVTTEQLSKSHSREIISLLVV
jgi:hypothetical protein